MSVALAEFGDLTAFSAGAVLTAAQLNSVEAGIQAEFEERMDAWAVPGVVSGGACSIDSADIDVATIDAYASTGAKLKRYDGAGSVTFTSSDASGTYYIYLDPDDDDTPLSTATSAPTDGECILCSVAWNGTDTLSSLVDLRKWGIVHAEFDCFGVTGAVSADETGHKTLTRDFWVEGMKASLETCGSAAGPTLIDLHGGTAGSEVRILSADGDRVSIAHDATDGAVANAGDFDATKRKLSNGNKLIVEVDAASTDAADLAVTVYGRYY